jgi:hypothetical protein
MAVIRKRVLCPQQLRQVPAQFSWIDHRLVRDRHIAGKTAEALALYLFLVTVADGQGLSYYSDAGIGKLLSLDGPALVRARQELSRAGLIAYEKPLYQVLSLDKAATARSTTSGPPARPAQATPEASPRREPLRRGEGPRLGVPQTLGEIIREMGRPP